MSIDKIRTQNMDDIVCPYCGERHSENEVDYELNIFRYGRINEPGMASIVECFNCEREFTVVNRAELTFSTFPIEEKETTCE